MTKHTIYFSNDVMNFQSCNCHQIFVCALANVLPNQNEWLMYYSLAFSEKSLQNWQRNIHSFSARRTIIIARICHLYSRLRVMPPTGSFSLFMNSYHGEEADACRCRRRATSEVYLFFHVSIFLNLIALFFLDKCETDALKSVTHF